MENTNQQHMIEEINVLMQYWHQIVFRQRQKRGEILPFYYGYPADHRALYADIDMDSYIFTNLHAATTRNIF